MGNRFKIVIVSLIASLFGSCINPHVAVIEQTDPMDWGGLDTICIDYNNIDTTSLLELSFILRVNKDYSEEDLIVNITTSDSTDAEVTDHITIEKLQHERGFSRYTSVVIPFRDRVRLNKGRYNFCISHNKSAIKSVHSVGIEINRSK